MRYDSEERFPIVDPDGRTIGSATRRECHSGSMLLHPVVHLHVIDADGRLLLQKRALTKDIQPGRWDTAVGGHVDLGESIGEALLREAAEELGISAEGARMVLRYEFRSDREHELVHTHLLQVAPGTPVRFAPDEITEVRFWTPDEIDAALGQGVFTPNFEQEWARLHPLIHA